MSTHKSSTTPVVAVDDGYAAIKVTAWRGSDGDSAATAKEGSEFRDSEIPALARRGRDLSDVNGAPIGAYESGGDTYTVFDQAATEVEPTRTEAYPTSTLNRVLVAHALVRAGYSGRSVIVGSGLPVRDFYAQGRPNSALIAAKIASLTTDVAASGEPKSARIIEAYVYPQAMMAWVDWAVDAKGDMIANRNQLTAAIVDVGGRTTDFAVLAPGGGGTPVVDHARSGSVDLGVLNVFDALSPLLQKKFDVRSIQPVKLVEAVKTRTITAFGQTHDVGAEVDEATQAVSGRLLAETQARIGMGMDCDVVLFVGGGAAVLTKALVKYPHLAVPSSPGFANARGILKYLTFLEPGLSGPVEVAESVVELRSKRASA